MQEYEASGKNNLLGDLLLVSLTGDRLLGLLAGERLRGDRRNGEPAFLNPGERLRLLRGRGRLRG